MNIYYLFKDEIEVKKMIENEDEIKNAASLEQELLVRSNSR
jgi:hypothetical protein